MKQSNRKEYYLTKAQENLPKLINSDISILNEVKKVYNNDNFVIDLGNHYVGYFSFFLGYTDRYPDAPVRLKIRFCESKDEIEADFSSYHGNLCPTWLQEEIINVDFVGEYKMTRRYAAACVWLRTLTGKKLKTMELENADKKLLNKITQTVNKAVR
ncbi:MAG: hypothetical protein U0M42_06120 [Acutalibacteraceae bacterium]|nr:hypothetical protein [Acutalibacteraceae bacterium]